MIATVLVVTVFVRLVSTQTLDDCPASIPRDQYLQVYGNTCFQFVLNKEKEFSQAENDCESRGGTLAVVSSPDIQDFLYRHLVHTFNFQHGSDVWIGLHDEAHENNYEWENGQVMTYSNWDSGEGPSHWNHESEDCVSLSPSTGMWKDHACMNDKIVFGLINFHNHEYPYICQYTVNGAAATASTLPSTGDALLTTKTAAVTTDARDQCPVDVARDQYLQVHGDTCFQFVLYQKREFAQAESDCESLGGKLAVVSSQDVQDFLYTHIVNTYHFKTGSDIWIGLHDEARENKYQWEDGTALSYSNWGNGEGPANWNHQSEDCVTLSPSTGQWKDHPCKSTSFLIIFSNKNEYPYICQYKIQTTTVQSPTPATTTASSASGVSGVVTEFSVTEGGPSTQSPATTTPEGDSVTTKSEDVPSKGVTTATPGEDTPVTGASSSFKPDELGGASTASVTSPY